MDRMAGGGRELENSVTAPRQIFELKLEKISLSTTSSWGRGSGGESAKETLMRNLPVRATRMIRHIATRAGELHRRFEFFMDARVLVFEFDLPAALLDTGISRAFAVLHAHKAVFPTAPTQRQIARRFGAGIEMLMEPLVGRHDDAAGFPIDALHLLPFRPQH